MSDLIGRYASDIEAEVLAVARADHASGVRTALLDALYERLAVAEGTEWERLAAVVDLAESLIAAGPSSTPVPRPLRRVQCSRALRRFERQMRAPQQVRCGARRRGAGRPAGRRCGASSSTASADPGDGGEPAPAAAGTDRWAA
ncbi:hypothetical protein FSW04_18920 [Baekduia soli]|uniref:Uncharacterized protein n=1 Tax=Baekduia soli TaxID=496014 RepID=A0A5B8U9G7_9ACTN|nr:hypothetical protein FSW04_18920 [Baekduia soli]